MRRSTIPVRLLTTALAAAAVAGTPAAVHAVRSDGTRPAPQAAQSSAVRRAPHWVATWTSMPQLTEPGNLPPAPFTEDDGVLVDATLRQTVHVSLGGRRVRLRFSNAFGGAALPITKAVLALPQGGQAGVSAVEPGTSRPLTFSGRSSIVVPTGAQVVSDPVRLDVAPESNLTVTMYLATGQASTSITSHPGSRTTSYLVRGDHTTDADLPGAAHADHWYFLSGAEVRSSGPTAAAAIVGDSLTDGRGSTTNGNDRWPDQLLARLQDRRATDDVAVLNQAAGGNRVLNDGLGPNALGRLDRDVLAQTGVDRMLLFEGVNDIGTAEATPAAQQAVAQDLITAYDQMITRAHAQGIRVFGATLTPFGGNTGYDDAQSLREGARQTVNRWIRSSGRFDGVVDFDRVARDPQQPRNLAPGYDVGDHLHLNPGGYRALADAVPARWFAQRTLDAAGRS
jgi:lysophospholipase L1-like esterase